MDLTILWTAVLVVSAALALAVVVLGSRLVGPETNEATLRRLYELGGDMELPQGDDEGRQPHGQPAAE